MARWKLIDKHYLNVPGTKWRHEETSQASGEKTEVEYKVPKYLDPDDPKFQNRDGEVIVCHAGKGEKGDIIFEGTPTNAMEPVDDEAEEITSALRPSWDHPIDSLPSINDQSMITQLQRENAEMKAALARAEKAPTNESRRL